jgi:N-acetylglucosaminyl-diphospho-decaprenol L-rhamnosyltransferase
VTGRRVLVVVVNHRSASYLPRLLDSLELQPDVAAVVLRDNGSGEQEVEALRRIAAGRAAVHLVLGANTGFGAGVNAAVRASPIDDWTHLWVLNPDTAVRPGALAALLETADREHCDVISPMLVQLDAAGQERIWFAGGEVDEVRGRSSHRWFGQPTSAAPSGFFTCGFLTGAAPLATRAAWIVLDGFAEHYFLYCEDTDLSVRATRHGLRLGVEPAAVVEHAQGGSSGGVGPVYCFYTQRNRLWMYRGLGPRLRVAFGAGRSVTLWLLLFPLRSSSRSSRPVRSVLASLRGLAAGFVGGRGGSVLP